MKSTGLCWIRVFRLAAILLCCSLVSGSLTAQEKSALKKQAATAKAKNETSDLKATYEKKFEELLTSSTLVGSWSIIGKNDKNPPQTERYEIQSASKLPNRKDYWVIVAKIQYGNKKASLPIPVTLKVLWAGDTPMISMTNLSIPGMGTFSARILFHGDRYAGTWQHDKVGGHMWGVIEKTQSSKSKETSTPKPSEK